MPIDGLVKLVIQTKHVRREPEYNVLWYSTDFSPVGGGEVTFANDAAAAANTLFAPLLVAAITSECKVVGFEVYATVNSISVYGFSVSDTAGSVAGDTLPSFAAVVLQKFTAVGGRTGRGRMYIGNVPESSAEDNVVNVAGKVLYDAIAAALLVPLVSGPANLVPGLYNQTTTTFSALNFAQTRNQLGRCSSRRQRTPMG